MADRAPNTRKAEGVAKTEAAPVPKFAIDRDILDRVNSLQSTADYIDVLAETVDEKLRALKNLIGTAYPSLGIANWGEWDRLETLLSLIMSQTETVTKVSEISEQAYMNADEVAA